MSDATRVFKIEIAAGIDRVWDEITTTTRVQPAMFNGRLDTKLVPGAKLMYTKGKGKWCVIDGEVLEVVAPTRFVHTFAFSKGVNEPHQRVSWDLEAVSPMLTRVTVTHENLDKAPKTAKSVAGVWPDILGRIKRVVEKGGLSAKDKIMFTLMEPMTGFFAMRVK
jgi:uncharacterized protein YndB with AHSA1/START domain